MGQYRFGTFTTTNVATARNINLGFVPSKFVLYNYTGFGTTAVVTQATYFKGMAAGQALVQTTATDADVTGLYQTPSIAATNGFTAYSTGGVYAATQAVITGASKANPCVITAVAHGFATGDTVTISAVGGMTQLNTNRYVITVLTVDTFSLKDLFGNAVDSSAFSTYTAGGIANKISTNSTPPGNEYDLGGAGITLGTGLFRASADVFYWEAFLETPTGW